MDNIGKLSDLRNLIAKYGMTTDGTSIMGGRKPSATDFEIIKAHKMEIIAEIKLMEAEAEKDKRRAKEEQQAKIAELIEQQKPLRKLAFCSWGGWESARNNSIGYIVPDEREDLADWYKALNPHCLAHDNEEIAVEDDDAIEAIGERKPDGPLWGNEGKYWLISDRDKAAILKKMAARLAAERAREGAEEAARQDKINAAFAEAKRTGEPAKISQWSEQCDGSAYDCSLDIVIKYAMPDDSTKIVRIHTF